MVDIILFDKAKKFILEQRIKELKKAIARWPDSPKVDERILELTCAEADLEEVNKKLLES
jgi:hypothetical protein